MTYRYEIAGLKIEIEGDWNEFAQNKAAAYKSSFKGRADIYAEVNLGVENIKLPDGELIAKEVQRHFMKCPGGGAAFYDYVPEISDEIINLITFDKTFSDIRMSLCKSSVLGLTVDQRPFNLFDMIMRFVSLMHNRIVLHASSISYKDNAILFSAASGTGKSTHTSLWKELYPETIIFNDDAPMIDLSKEEIIACGTPWCGTSGVNENKSAPLKAIVFIERAKECSIKRIFGAEAIFRIINETKKPLFPNMMQVMLDKLSQILSTIPTYVLYCDISYNAVETVKKELGL